MSIIRVIHNQENPFVQLNKKALWNENISLKAIGLWARCLSRPDNWSFNVKELVAKCKEGRKAIDGAINELIEHGYAVRINRWEKSKDGRFAESGVDYAFFEFPATQEDKDKVLEEFKKSFQHCHFGNLRNGNLQKEHLLIKKETETHKKEYIPEPAAAEQPSLPIPKPKKDPLDPTSEEFKLSNLMLQKIKKQKENFSGKITPTWIKDSKKVLTHRSVAEVHKVIEWVYEDSFWSGIVLSPGGLLRNLDKIEMQMVKRVDPKTSRVSEQEGNRKLGIELEKKMGDISGVDFYSDYIGFSFGPMCYVAVKYSDYGFRDQIENNFRKKGININNLEAYAPQQRCAG